MALDRVVYRQQLLVVHAVVALIVLRADDACVAFGHEVLQQRHARLCVQVAAILGGIRNHLVHLVQLPAGNRVGDQRRLVQGLVVRALGLHPRIHHLLKSELDARLDHGNHDDGIIEVLLLRDFHAAGRGLLKACLGGLLAPLQKVGVVVVPILHHRLREVARNNVVLVLHVQRAHDLLQLLGQLEALDFRWIVQAVHHASDSAVLQSLGLGLPTVLDQLRSVPRLNARRHHLVEAQYSASLQHAAQDGLLTHQVALDLRDEAAQQDAGTVSTGRGRVRLGELQTLALGVVLRVHSDERRHAEAALVLLADLRAGAFRGDHDDGQIVTDLHAFLHDVEAVAVREGRTLLHQRHNLGHDSAVLLVRRQVQHQICVRDELLISPDRKAIGCGVNEAGALAVDGLLPQRVTHVAARISHVQPLVQALGPAADDHELFVCDHFRPVGELVPPHESAPAELVKLGRMAQSVEIIGTLVGRTTQHGAIHG
mmetsp:Transcript_19762/g.59135  ORF Transcript_19762/g.59135 Transcript_19762/m.59135 type:complete len:484 (+) Transcript_19762:258-1709(+)